MQWLTDSVQAMDGFGDIRTVKHIPLICSVCPDSPRFSDVSHLLTHIASKGHLHHVTQTKLKSHQDIVSAVALQQYEQWYRDNGIEVLLVERMKAKQVKEALKGRHTRAINPGPSIPPPSRVSIQYSDFLYVQTLIRISAEKTIQTYKQ